MDSRIYVILAVVVIGIAAVGTAVYLSDEEEQSGTATVQIVKESLQRSYNNVTIIGGQYLILDLIVTYEGTGSVSIGFDWDDEQGGAVLGTIRIEPAYTDATRTYWGGQQAYGGVHTLHDGDSVKIRQWYIVNDPMPDHLAEFEYVPEYKGPGTCDIVIMD